jgi:hypothetical protein
LSSDDIIGRILNLRLNCSDEEEKSSALSAKLHPLIVILKQAVIREASMGTVAIKTDGKLPYYPYVDALKLKDRPQHGWIEYDLIPKETP